MICDIKLSDYQEPKRCELNGCTQLMTVYHREDRDQLYYQCDGHFDVIKRSVTLHSFWYNRKAKANRILNTVTEYIRGNSIGKINKSIRNCPDAARQVLKDIQMMMLSDYRRYAMGDEQFLGADPRCHHIQIDESIFGKRKNHRGRRVEFRVFGMVEALVPEDTPLDYRYTDNRLGATLLPLLFRYCKAGSIVRSDGWRGYEGLHNKETAAVANFQANGLHFYAHQLVNHSEGFATVDQVEPNPHVSGTPLSGMIHTNIIESLWRDLKVFIKPRNRNSRDCAGKLLEYLWRHENRDGLMDAMWRIMKEVQFASSTAFEVTEDDPAGNIEPEFFTAAANGESEAQTERRRTNEARLFDAWVARRRTAEQPAEEREEDSADEADADVEALYFAENSARGQSNTVPNSATRRRASRNNRNTDVLLQRILPFGEEEDREE
ncbi:hypothetical protein INT47_004040 [Mucor saturninus]|uniref:ISXO2-like transposase domain-containing protein n=1 Tax=Mucor saturninus TaxID=64648 RepID=A0A8H7QFN0_9FUNG|nr:hypothetical protein INT47_004040 [Mucor saturninus]